MRPIHLFAILLIAPIVLRPATSAQAQIGIGLAITIAPPVLITYAQPPMPEIGTIWTPGYWAYGNDGYYWVPGTWVLPPSQGVYWTPGYWGWQSGSYLFHTGYWGPQVGYYGGINYGYGYGGTGYQGGEWHGHDFAYNRSANNFGGVRVTNVYERPIGRDASTGPSFNGPGGATGRPTPQEEAAGRLGHTEPTAQQTQHAQAASQDRELRASVNHGHPTTAAMSRPAGPGSSPPPGLEATPAGREATPAGREAMPALREAAPATHQATPAGREAAPAGHPAPAAHEAAPVRREATPAARPAAPTAQQHEAAAPHPAAPAHPAPQREAAPPRQAPERQVQQHQAPQHQAGPLHAAAHPAQAPHAPPHQEEHK
jgi:hypothetical protein